MELAFRKYGEGKPLLILHGLFGQSDNWTTLARQFSEQGYSVYTIDQRNHGLSPHSEIWTYEAMADDLKEFIELHRLEKPILIGHSMGGKTAMFFALKYPEVLKKLIVSDISPRRYEPHHQEVLKGLKAVDFSKIQTRKEAETIMMNFIPDFGTRQFLLKNIYWEDSESNRMNWRFNLKVIERDYEEVGKEVPEGVANVEALFIRGSKSDYILESDRPEIQLRFPNSHIDTIADAGHWIHAEKPKAFFDCVMNFIR